MSDRAWRRLFAAAAAFNVAAGLPPLVAPARALETFGMAPLPSHLFMQSTGLLVLTFGVAYALVSRNLALREIVWLGIIGKLGVAILFGWSMLRGLIPPLIALVGMGDLLFVVAFGVFLASHPAGARRG